VKLDVLLSENCVIKDIIISGDFFAYPEDAIERLESRIRECSSRVCIEEAFKELVNTTILGVNVEDLKNRVILLLEDCKKSQNNS